MRAARRRSGRRRAPTIRLRSSPASSSVSVRSGEPNATRNASERLPSPTCSPRYSSKTATRPQLRPAPPRGSRSSSAAAGTSSSTTNARSCRTSGYGLTSSNSTASGAARDERVEVELERAPRPLEQRRVQLADPALARCAPTLPGWRNGSAARSYDGSTFSAAYSCSTAHFASAKPPSTMPATCQRSSGSASPAR